MRKLYSIAMFMIALIVSMPVVFAQELSIQQFNGKGSSKGVARTHDELTIEVLAKIPGEDIIDKDQVRLYVEDSYATFDSCNATGNGYYKCRFFEPDFEAYEPIAFTIELRDDDGNIVGSETKTLIVDANAPVIKSYTVEPNITSGDVSVSYAAEDYGLNYGSTDQCAGIKQVIITAGNVSVTDAGEQGLCAKDNTLTMTLTKSGKQQVCATATDHANYASAPRCQEVRVDKSPPNIEKLSILDDEGFLITHVHSGEERSATVTVTIADDGGIDSNQVFADFYQLNPNLPDAIPPDTSNGDLYSWTGIAVSEVNPCQIKVSATDTLGNTATQNFSCAIRADDTPPVVQGVVSDANRGGVPLFGYASPLIVELEDKDNSGAEGIGFNSKKVYLDLHALGMGSNAQADGCSRYSGATWRCIWFLTPPANVAEGTYKISVLSDSSDDLGNIVGTSSDYDIIYDNTGPYPPQIVDFKIISGEQGVEYQGGAVKGSFVQYTVRSSNFSTAYANFTDIGGSAHTDSTECKDVGNASDCTFESLVDLSGPYTAYLTFTFADDANNSAHTSTTLEIYGIDNETSAKYWKTPPTVTCSPSIIDRKLATLIPPIVTCRVDLETPRRDITTLAIAGPTAPDECTGDIELTLNDVYVTNTAEGSTHPYLFMKLEPKNYYVNSTRINCPLSVYSKRAVTLGNKTSYYVSPRPQEVPANITISYYNNPLGDMNSNIDDDIRSAMHSGLAGQKWISDLRKFLHYGEMICQLKVLLTNIISALYLVTVVLGITGAVVQKIPVVGTAAAVPILQAAVTTCNAEEGWSEGYKGVLDFLDSVCSVINCAAVSGKGTGIQAYAGGGVPWCSDARAFFKELDITGSGMLDFDVKNSLILSILCLCLPGIIYNLDKLRQIDCFKAVCLHDDVKLSGYPASFCSEMHGYMICAFVIGEIFSLVPFAAFFDKLISMVLDMITNPVALFTTLLGAVCTAPHCYNMETSPVGFILCSTLKTVSTVAEAVAAVKTMSKSKSMFGTVGNNYCDRMEDIKDEMEQEEA